MPIPSSGTISMADIRTELGTSGSISLGDTAVRDLAGVASGSISLGDFYGASVGGFIPFNVDIYVIGGGGGGGQSGGGGGGGGGGFTHYTATISGPLTWNVVIGAGGIRRKAAQGSDLDLRGGTSSVNDTMAQAYGGGAGGLAGNDPDWRQGVAGHAVGNSGGGGGGSALSHSGDDSVPGSGGASSGGLTNSGGTGGLMPVAGAGRVGGGGGSGGANYYGVDAFINGDSKWQGGTSSRGRTISIGTFNWDCCGGGAGGGSENDSSVVAGIHTVNSIEYGSGYGYGYQTGSATNGIANTGGGGGGGGEGGILTDNDSAGIGGSGFVLIHYPDTNGVRATNEADDYVTYTTGGHIVHRYFETDQFIVN